jgi:hypothetical protein
MRESISRRNSCSSARRLALASATEFGSLVVTVFALEGSEDNRSARASGTGTGPNDRVIVHGELA